MLKNRKLANISAIVKLWAYIYRSTDFFRLACLYQAHPETLFTEKTGVRVVKIEGGGKRFFQKWNMLNCASKLLEDSSLKIITPYFQSFLLNRSLKAKISHSKVNSWLLLLLNRFFITTTCKFCLHHRGGGSMNGRATKTINLIHINYKICDTPLNYR